MVSRMRDPICPSIDPFVSSVEAYDRFVPRDSAVVPSAFEPPRAVLLRRSTQTSPNLL
ncbi:hypothetical protein MA16_Dca014889 [Dendrobium catenatum]|uniref:Uncharacterized protein n=1 Tax=Dendrobium catenatum TaxID=906689 RepID=A0A2I0WSJ1_9ASPA|nr:hypothetical protein MA16_Dca014889 [Dendrobium catenatum]